MNQYQLSKIDYNDIPYLVEWFNDKEIGRYMEDSSPNQKYSHEDIIPIIASKEDLYWAFKHNNTIIGYASIYNINKENKRGEFSFLIGDKNYYGKKLGPILVDLVTHQAKHFGLQELYCTIVSDNVPSIKSVIKAGFEKSNCIKLHSELNVKNNGFLFLKNFYMSEN